METAIRFNASNRSRNFILKALIAVVICDIGEEESLSGKMGRGVRWNLENRKTGDSFCSVVTTSGAMNKWRPRLNSAHLKALETILKEALIAVMGCDTGEDVCPKFLEL